MCIGLTLKEIEKEILKLFFNALRFCIEWENDPIFTNVMDTVSIAQLRNAMDFREALP